MLQRLLKRQTLEQKLFKKELTIDSISKLRNSNKSSQMRQNQSMQPREQTYMNSIHKLGGYQNELRLLSQRLPSNYNCIDRKLRLKLEQNRRYKDELYEKIRSQGSSPSIFGGIHEETKKKQKGQSRNK